MAADTFKISPEQVYTEIWECRNFEIDHLWQRSVFLAVFLLAIAGGYGSVVKEMLFPEASFVVDFRHHLLAYGLCWLGIVFSILWVMMAKGSKHSFEQYEAAICWFLHSSSADYGAELTEKGMPYYGNLPKLSPERTNENIFSPLAGNYSVSKVNCMIGIISLYAWMFLDMVHFGKFLIHLDVGLDGFRCALLSVAQLLFFGCVLLTILRFLCQTENEDEEQ